MPAWPSLLLSQLPTSSRRAKAAMKLSAAAVLVVGAVVLVLQAARSGVAADEAKGPKVGGETVGTHVFTRSSVPVLLGL